MRKISVTKEFVWDMAHMLAGYEGECRNLHGHSYKMQVEVCRMEGNLISDSVSQGMVVDFKDLKDIVKSIIIEPLDHCFMYWKNSTEPVEHEIARLLKESGRKVAEVSYRPTVEEMVMDFYNVLSKEMENNQLELLCLRVWETATSFAEIKKEKA